MDFFQVTDLKVRRLAETYNLKFAALLYSGSTGLNKKTKNNLGICQKRGYVKESHLFNLFTDKKKQLILLAPVVQRPDNFILWISHYTTVSICAKLSLEVYKNLGQRLK